jgi:uncharacterized protein YecA (UPF0149 family)
MNKQSQTMENEILRMLTKEPAPHQTYQKYVPKKEIPYRRPHAKIGRNDYCPCGSGLKYKNCCLRYEGTNVELDWK